VPLTVRGRVLGAMGFARSAGHPAFALEDRALAEDLARRTALAIENARLYEEARASEARFRTLVDATVAGVVLADAEGGLAYANDAYLRIVGYDRADFDAGRVRWTDLTPPEWAEADRRGGLVHLYRDLIALRRNLGGQTRGLGGQHRGTHRREQRCGR